MANKVLLKKSAVTTKVPLPGDLDYGELAINYADEKIYFKNSSNAIKSFSTTGVSLETLTIGTGLSGTSYNGTTAVTIQLNDTGVTAGSYGSATGIVVPVLTVDAQGRVTTASSTTINSSTLVSTLGYTPENSSNKGIALGYASLDASGKVPASQLPGTGTVTSVGGTGTVSGLTLTGTVTTSGNLTLGGTLSVTPSNFASQVANTFLSAPNGTNGAPSFRSIVAADIPTLNQDTTGSAATLTTGRTIALTGDVSYTSGSFNGSANVTGTATLTSVGTAGTYTKVTTDAKGRVTSGTTLVAADIPTLNQNTTGTAANVTGTVAIANGGTGATTSSSALTNLGAYPSSNPSGYTSNLGTVTSVGGTGTVSGLTLSGTVTTSGTLSLGGALSVTPSNFASQPANTFLSSPNGAAGVPTFRTIVAADIPTLNQNTTGTSSNVTGTVAVTNGGTGATTAAGALTNLGAYAATNPNGYTNNTGTVTSVSGTGSYGGLTLTGTVTTTGSLTLGGTPTGTWPINVSGNAANVTGTVPIANGGTGSTTADGARTNLGLTSTATTQISAGGGFGIPLVNLDGTMEISRYIDFHAAGGDAVDYVNRLESISAGVMSLNGNNLLTAGNYTQYVSGGADSFHTFVIDSNGNLDVISYNSSSNVTTDLRNLPGLALNILTTGSFSYSAGTLVLTI